jgi:hypothetical protein
MGADCAEVSTTTSREASIFCGMAKAATGVLEQFSLRFRGDRASVYPQRIYAIKHDSMGEFELFLVPVERDDSGTFYEAVFNRVIQQEPVNHLSGNQEQDQDQDRQKAS